MKVLLGIIFFHVLVIVRSKISDKETVPYISTLVISMVLVVFVLFMMFTMDKPQP